MTGQKQNAFVHELVLILYHSKFRDKYLSAETVAGIDKFMDMCRAKDMLDNSQTAFVVEHYYDIRNGLTIGERRACGVERRRVVSV